MFMKLKWQIKLIDVIVKKILLQVVAKEIIKVYFNHETNRVFKDLIESFSQ